MNYPPHLLKLIQVLKKLPGIGNKSAERFAFQMLDWAPQHLNEMADTIRSTPNALRHCSECYCLVGKEQECPFCDTDKRNIQILSVIASAKDAYALECTHEYKGLYHVLGGLLSPMEGVGPDRLHFPKLFERIKQYSIQEVIIALDSTLEGDATALYLKKELEPFEVNVSRLAFGLPMGSPIDYVDGGTLARALAGRSHF